MTQRFRVLPEAILTGHKAANGHNLLIDTMQVARIKPVTFQLREGLPNHFPPKSFAASFGDEVRRSEDITVGARSPSGGGQAGIVEENDASDIPLNVRHENVKSGNELS